MGLRRVCLKVFVAAFAALACASVHAQAKFITVASTTSTEQSGLFKHLLPEYTKKTGVEVRVVAVGHRPGARHGPPRRCRRRVRARPGRREKVHGRRLRRELPPGHVQRLHPHRAEVRPGERRRARTCSGGAAEDQGGAGAVRFARRQERHARGRAAPVESRRRRHPEGQGPLVQGDRFGDGTGAEHRVGDERLHPRRPRHLAVVQEPRRSRDPGRRRQQALQPVRDHAGEPGEASAREKGPRRRIHRVGRFRRKGRRRSPTTRSAASSCSSPTRGRVCKGAC